MDVMDIQNAITYIHQTQTIDINERVKLVPLFQFFDSHLNQNIVYVPSDQFKSTLLGIVSNYFKNLITTILDLCKQFLLNISSMEKTPENLLTIKNDTLTYFKSARDFQVINDLLEYITTPNNLSVLNQFDDIKILFWSVELYFEEKNLDVDVLIIGGVCLQIFPTIQRVEFVTEETYHEQLTTQLNLMDSIYERKKVVSSVLSNKEEFSGYFEAFSYDIKGTTETYKFILTEKQVHANNIIFFLVKNSTLTSSVQSNDLVFTHRIPNTHKEDVFTLSHGGFEICKDVYCDVTVHYFFPFIECPFEVSLEDVYNCKAINVHGKTVQVSPLTEEGTCLMCGAIDQKGIQRYVKYIFKNQKHPIYRRINKFNLETYVHYRKSDEYCKTDIKVTKFLDGKERTFLTGACLINNNKRVAKGCGLPTGNPLKPFGMLVVHIVIDKDNLSQQSKGVVNHNKSLSPQAI
ncbi:hypothetical protein EIN_018340 [Entamoeba invadens IP1]|uniref:hypothetical protein n=1 Tax=Entamoeba invadens IP1 TaxID=370355 RepID=UPI0002C3E861|nr:hypothetical protein EIN_018340 [Entamoeba invadens IP1]ELP90485.1 hypothetical protein EIN_018340 [Entamoeba invadens IP1]|eukprot:XP_004257256.1 hypothetical protein EIN_018340 [Entamoeba invadens IP1]